MSRPLIFNQCIVSLVEGKNEWKLTIHVEGILSYNFFRAKKLFNTFSQSHFLIYRTEKRENSQKVAHIMISRRNL